MSKTKDFLILSQRRAQEHKDKLISSRPVVGSIEDIEKRNERKILTGVVDEMWNSVEEERERKQFVKNWIEKKEKV
jgi:hypothetical protein